MQSTGKMSPWISKIHEEEKYSAEYVSNYNLLVSWKENKTVRIASNFLGIGNENEVKRWDKSKSQHIFMKQPEVIVKCNQYMTNRPLF